MILTVRNLGVTSIISSLLMWSGKRDSNPRPSAWEADALPTELFPRWDGKVSNFFIYYLCGDLVA